MARTRVPASVPVHPALALLLAAALALAAAAPPRPAPRARRQLADDASLQPVDEAAAGAGAARERRKLDGVAQASFGVKNAVLGLVFGKINSLIDAKTRLVETLDKTNIEKNRALGIEPPPSGISSFGTIFGQLVGPVLQLVGPKVQAVSGLVGSLSGGSAGSGTGSGSGGGGGGGLGSVLSLVSSLSGSSSGGAGPTVDTVDSEEEEDDSS